MGMFIPDCCEHRSVLKVCMLLLIVSKTLCVNLRCNDCDKGYFISRNCSQVSPDEWTGTQCQLCSKCGEGQKILENCTRFSNTLCGCENGYVQTSNSNCEKEITTSTSPIVVTPRMKQRRIGMMAAVPVFLVFLIVLAVSVLFGASVSFKPGRKLLKNSIISTSCHPDIV